MSSPCHPLRLTCCCLLVAGLGGLHAARREPSESKEAATKQGERPARKEALLAAEDLAITDPRRALEDAGQISSSEARRAAQLRCLREWTLRDPEAAVDWAMQIADEAGRSQALAEVAAAWASFDPLAGATLTADFISTQAALERAIPAVVGQSGPGDQAQVREWIESFPESSLKDLAQAEFTRLARKLPAAPASLPGEATEQRTPPFSKTKNP